jgi:hypothetical protein
MKAAIFARRVDSSAACTLSHAANAMTLSSSWCRSPISATAALRPIMAMIPMSKWRKGGRGWPAMSAAMFLTDRFSDRGETRNLSHFQSPGQRRDGPHSRNRLEALDAFGRRASRCSELTRAHSVFCSRTTVSRLPCSSGRILSFTSSLLASSSRK